MDKNIDMEYVIDFLGKIMDIPSPSGDTKEAMEFVEKEFKSFEIKTRKTKKGAVVATIPGKNNEDIKTISAHIDTLGAMVKEIKDSGRLKLSQVGGYTWTSVEGENVIIKTMDGKFFTGTILPEKSSVHIFSKEPREDVRTNDNMEVRIDEITSSRKETEELGIRVGDYLYFEPRFEVTKSGFIKSRHLDDKAAVAIVLGMCKYIKDNNITPLHTTNFFISNYEEVGHGVTDIPEETTEFVAIDIGTVGKGQASDEFSVCICAKDAKGPYDYELRKKLVQIAEKNNIGYKVDIYNNYGSDASALIQQGFNVVHACVGPGVESTHHYERTHVKAIENNIKLLINYICN